MAIHRITNNETNNNGGVVKGSFTSSLLNATNVSQSVNAVSTRGYGGTLLNESGLYFKQIESPVSDSIHYNLSSIDTTVSNTYTALSGFTGKSANSGNFVVYNRKANDFSRIRYFVGVPQRYEYFTTLPNQDEILEVITSYTHTYNNLQYIFDGNGLSLVKLGDSVIASGGLYFHNKGNVFGLGNNEWFSDEIDKNDISFHYEANTKTYSDKTITKYTINNELSRLIVKHTYTAISLEGVEVYQQYTLNGPEITTKVWVTNNTNKNITVPSIGGLNLLFDRIPDGIYGFGEDSGVNLLGPINAAVKDYQLIEDGFVGNGDELYMSLAYARDSRFGFCFTPISLERQSTYLSNYKSNQEDSLRRKILEYQKLDDIGPNEQGGMSFKIKFTESTAWQDITSSYKDVITLLHGGLKYTTNNWKFFSQNVIDNGIDGFGSGNPYSIQESIRLDNTPKTQYYLDSTLKGTYNSGLSAVVYWNLEGRHPREGVYRMENDVMPPEVRNNFSNILVPYFSGQDIKYGVNVNFRNFNAKRTYHGIHRDTFTQPNQTQEIPLRLYKQQVVITASGTPRQFSKTLNTQIDAGNYGTARYHVTGAFTGTIKLQYLVPTGTWTDAATITTQSTNTVSMYHPSEYVDTKWRFIASNWTNGTGICTLYNHYSSDNSFNFSLNSSETAFSGNCYLEYKDRNWIQYNTYKGIIFTNKDQIVEYTARPNEKLYFYYTTPSGWAGQIVVEYNPSGTWLPAPGVSNGIVRRRDVAAVEKSVLSTSFTTSITGWRVRSSGTWLSQANVFMGHWFDETKHRIIPTDWRIRTDSAFTGILHTTMYEDSMTDFLGQPTQFTRGVTNIDFDSHLNMYKEKLQNSMNLGMNYFYADTVSRYYEEFLTLKELRRQLGTNWQVIPEYYNDYMVAYGGLFTTAQCTRSPIGTRQSRTLTSGNAISNIPYPVFVAPLFTLSMTGSFGSGSVFLERSSGNLWQTVATFTPPFTSPLTEEYESQNSYLTNTKYRLRTSPNFSGNLSTVLMDNLGYNSNGSANQTYITKYNENDMVSTYTISASGESSKPTPYFRPIGPVVIHLNSSSWSDGSLHIQKYITGSGWQNVKTYTSVPTIPYEEFEISQDENWRYKTGGTWNGTLYLSMGQWRSKVPGYLTSIFRNIYGSGIEQIVKLGAGMQSSLAGSYYEYCFKNGFKPNPVASYEASGIAIQNKYLNSDGSRK